MTARPSKQAARSREERLRLDARLDEALLETFPASDPIAVHSPTATERPGRAVDRKAALPDRTTEAVGKRAPRKRRARG